MVVTPREDECQPASRIGLSKQQPARLLVRRLDDTPCEENSTVKERLDLGWLDAVLPILGAVAGIPVELACHSGDAGEPLVKAAVWRNLH